MKNDQFTYEFQDILSRQPAFTIRSGIFLWIFWICSVVLGSLFLMILLANLFNGVLTDNLIALLFDRSPGEEGRRWFLYLVSAVCAAIAFHSLSIAWLIQLVLQRNTHISLQNEFIERILEEHKELEYVAGVLKEDYRRLH
ncbi:MAG: hypothetical protein ACT6QS_14190 [Flavobacteriales bacterium]